MRKKIVDKRKIFDYFIIVSRFLLAIVFIQYGYSKLTQGQFGLSEEELAKPIKELSLMQVGWFLFDQQPFKAFIGVSQIICGILLLLNRTVLIGALLFLPIAINILIIDLTIMPKESANPFTGRFIFYILLDLLILYHYRIQAINASQIITQNTEPKFEYKIWLYLIVPVLALILEFTPALPALLYGFITQPAEMWNLIKETIGSISKVF